MELDMFDANASHVNIGEKIFVEVHGSSEFLESKGIYRGDILLCEHVKKSGERFRKNDHSKLWKEKDGECVDYLDESDGDDFAWLVYSGRPNGGGFINDTWKAKALNLLGGKWEK